ncbi:MAG: TonB family protein [Candidatus Omnitrophota bacterium]
MKSKAILIICILALVMADAWAQAAENVKLVVNELKVFPVTKLRRVAVGSPEVADINVLNEREVMVVAKEEGVTTLIIWDDKGERSFTIAVIKKDIQEDAKRILDLLARSGIVGLEVTTEKENIYIMGEVPTDIEVEKVKNILASFKNTVNLTKVRERQPMVEIAVTALEVNFDDLKRLGMDWTNSQPIDYNEPTGHEKDGKMPKMWRVFQWDRSTIDAQFNFLVETDQARTLANPKLITLSGKEASFLVGGEVPYVTVESEGRTSVEWKEYGVNLKINPIVTANNEIKTKVLADVTGLDWGNAVQQDGYNIPALRKREVQTELFLEEGDTIFLAGLITNDDSRNIDRLPWLGRIPIIGELFKSKEFRDERTELVISIVPRILGEKNPTAPKNADVSKSEAVSSSSLSPYIAMIGNLISSKVEYPRQAQQASQEGVVKLDLNILSSGMLKDVKIQESSGFDTLDRSALTAVLEQAPFPPFPADATQQELRLTVPVVFKSYVKNE